MSMVFRLSLRSGIGINDNYDTGSRNSSLQQIQSCLVASLGKSTVRPLVSNSKGDRIFAEIGPPVTTCVAL